MDTCECGYQSTSGARNLQRHKKSCLRRIIVIKDNQINDLVSQVTSLKQEVEQLKINQKTINNFNINIIPFGSEPSLTTDEVKPLLYRPFDSVPKYIELKHFGKENTANIRISNKRGNTIQILEHDSTKKRMRWVEKDKKEEINKLTDLNLDELKDRYSADKVGVWRQWYNESGLADNGYDKTQTWKNLVKQVENVLVTNRFEVVA